jgi:hypothetical protein
MKFSMSQAKYTDEFKAEAVGQMLEQVLEERGSLKLLTDASQASPSRQAFIAEEGTGQKTPLWNRDQMPDRTSSTTSKPL